MLELQNEIKITSKNGEQQLILKTLYLVQINYTFAFSGKTNLKSHTSHFCIRKEQIENFIISLSSNNVLAEIDDNDSDGYIHIFKSNEDILVQAQIGGSYEMNLYIEFEITERNLIKFLEDLQELLRYDDIN